MRIKYLNPLGVSWNFLIDKAKSNNNYSTHIYTYEFMHRKILSDRRYLYYFVFLYRIRFFNLTKLIRNVKILTFIWGDEEEYNYIANETVEYISRHGRTWNFFVTDLYWYIFWWNIKITYQWRLETQKYFNEHFIAGPWSVDERLTFRLQDVTTDMISGHRVYRYIILLRVYNVYIYHIIAIVFAVYFR